MDFANECLEAHNKYRGAHGTPPLKLSKKICDVSQSWADHLKAKNQFAHSTNKEYGENLYYFRSSDPKDRLHGKKPVEEWYSEIKGYKFGQEPANLEAGHFTQLIWKDTKEMGVAFAKAGEKTVVVANYFPPGNVVGRFAANVPPPQKEKQESSRK